jgi:DNA-binding transcriptional regulator YiaG
LIPADALIEQGQSIMTAVVRHQAKPKRRGIPTKPKRKPSRVKARTSSVRPSATLELRHRLQLGQAIFARLLPVSVRTLATLESGAPPTDVVARRLMELKRLTEALAEVMKKESPGKWLQTPNDAFDGLKPIEVIDRGESDRIWSMVYFLRSGVAS